MLDPVTFAVVRSALAAAASEMATVFKRTTMLPVIYEYNDFGMSVYDDRLNLIADAPGLPLFIGSLDFCVGRTLEEIGGAERLVPGDVLLTNHPYLTAGQPADAAVIEPIFHEGALIGYGALRAHMGDVGAKGPYPTDSTDIFQEGVIFPGVKLEDGGTLNETVLRVLRANSRIPFETAGNVMAAIGALRAARRKVIGVVERYGRDTYYEVIDEMLLRSERATRAAIEAIPDGTYVYEDRLDDNGVDDEPVPLRCAVIVAGDEIEVDLTGSAPEQRGPVNCPYGYTVTTCRFALKRVFSPDLPASSGEYRPLTVTAPEKSIFNPRPPAPCFIGAWTSVRLSDMIVQALAEPLPELIPAESGGDLVTAVAYLRDPASGRLSMWADGGGLGHGATSGADGMNALVHPVEAGVETVPAEVLEARMPIVVRRFGLIPDSGGPGAFRGGLAVEKEFEFRGDGEAVSVADKAFHSQVRGLAGGMPAPELNQLIWFPGTDRELRLGKRSGIALRSGDVVISRSAGGGGWGDPLDRELGRVEADLLDGYVTAECAERFYGVVLDQTGRVDRESSVTRRATLGRQTRPAAGPGGSEQDGRAAAEADPEPDDFDRLLATSLDEIRSLAQQELAERISEPMHDPRWDD
jgi:N-methylhydantoinase B